MPNDWVELDGWCWGLQLGSVGLICTKPPTHSTSRDIRSDWWFVMVAGSVSISFAQPHPTPSYCCLPIRFSAALQGNLDSDTLWERGRQKDLHAKPGRGMYLICLQSLSLNAKGQKLKEIKFVYIHLHPMIQMVTHSWIRLFFICCHKHCREMAWLLIKYFQITLLDYLQFTISNINHMCPFLVLLFAQSIDSPEMHVLYYPM